MIFAGITTLIRLFRKVDHVSVAADTAAARVVSAADTAAAKVVSAADTAAAKVMVVEAKVAANLKATREIHTLVNSGQIKMLKLTAELSRWKAERSPGDSAAAAAADQAERDYAAQLARQALADRTTVYETGRDLP